MNKLIVENLNLLDKMHEGLIVISENDRTLQFASEPAMRILRQKPETKKTSAESTLSVDKTQLTDISYFEIDQNDLHKPIFNLTTVSVSNEIQEVNSK